MVRYIEMAECMRNRAFCGDVGEWLEDRSQMEVQVLGYPRDLRDRAGIDSEAVTGTSE
jgi:hypothetical protein